ncbi:hypothetical protein [Runella sp.]|uniref:hypothetical protein n=1 Tax=Runella sp. TaxID=1960881 RepID=UPI003D1139D9
MNTKMIWVKVAELVAENKNFQIINMKKGENNVWCLTEKGIPLMYQKTTINNQPFCNTFCLIETTEQGEKINNIFTIKAFISGIS